MNYEIIYLEEKMVAGLRIRIGNTDSNMTECISELWKEFFMKGIYKSIPNKINDKAIGLYTNYESDFNGKYDMMVCCEVSDCISLPKDIQVQTIPSGKYAKFIIKGDVQKAVADFWKKLWSMDLDRKYSCDFEEYQNGCEDENSEIHIYISLN